MQTARRASGIAPNANFIITYNWAGTLDHGVFSAIRKLRIESLVSNCIKSLLRHQL